MKADQVPHQALRPATPARLSLSFTTKTRAVADMSVKNYEQDNTNDL